MLYFLEHRAISVCIYLDSRANSKGECWPSIGRIAKDLKLSRRTVIRALNDLRGAGLVTTEQRYRKDGGKSSLGFRVKLNFYTGFLYPDRKLNYSIKIP